MFDISIPVMIILAKAKSRDKRRRRGACYNIYILLLDVLLFYLIINHEYLPGSKECNSSARI
jgi:hypothetical protein